MVPHESADGPEISGGCSYSNKELPDHIKALILTHVRVTKQDSGPYFATVSVVGVGGGTGIE